ncbi:tyrosine-protein kinase ABL1-like isoform X2 [Homarus americanus]|uniref:tyrosine-protein kinase ABL1-like isoform X2 n=1 Tax=Homarus americanus TaxID=6706 RepID=UPI001C464124|nr:tyrosine-protein kinase ABL1-like isoform X2 [Homarus americanus]
MRWSVPLPVTRAPALEVVGTRPPSLYVTQPDRVTSDLATDHDHARPRNTVTSPERKTGGGGGGREDDGESGGRGGGGGGGGTSSALGSTPGKKQEAQGKMSVTLSKRDLLNHMVSQTKQHRQQIRSLENELERLRSGDMLNKCEVSVGDVEWRPGDVVGEGSFSTVYRGTYCGTEVAVKELKFKLSQDDKNYFRSESALLQQLHHPRVVLLMGVCTGAARPFMLLEYLSGGTLYNLIHSTTRERLDHAAYFVVAKDVAQGMNYLHKHEPQVLHLDLKSMNVLLDCYYRAKIADFGFSILRRSRTGSPAQRGSIRGTPAWMAPELLTKGDVSAKCDVYSYAIILWEMLTASHPFKGLDIFQIMETIEAGGRPPLPSSGVSRELKELITSCWAQNPSLRPSFEEILGALESAAVPVSWRGVLQKANIAPSLLSDVAAARTIIGVVEQSVELMRRSLQLQRANRNRNKEKEVAKDEQQPHVYETLDAVTFGPARLSTRDEKGGKSSRSPREQSSPVHHASPSRRPSPSKQPRQREVSSARQKSSGRSPERDRQREPAPRDDGRRRSPDKRSRPPRSDFSRVGAARDIRDNSVDRRGGRKGVSRERGREQLVDSRQESKDRRKGNRHGPEYKKDRENKGRDVRGVKERRKEERETRERIRKSRDRDLGNYEWEDERGYDRGRRAPKQVHERRNVNNIENYPRDRRSNSLESRRERVDCRSSSRDHQSSSNERRFSSSDRHSELRREIRRRNRFYSRERQSSREQRGGGKRHSRSGERLADSRDSLGDSPDESWTSLEGSSSAGSNNVLDDPDDHRQVRDQRRYSSSPRRRSPERRYSPTVRNSEHHRRSPDRHHSPEYHHSPERRHSPRSPQRRSRIRTPENRRVDSGSRLGPLVTSEQLMSQKQRLRPVRPAALSDLTNMPEHSLNDISLILKTAITKRRDAFDEGLSGRDTFRSEDVDWSDWH